MTTPAAKSTPLLAEGSWDALLAGSGRATLERVALPAFLARQRWFGGKTRTIGIAEILDAIPLVAERSVLALVLVRYTDGGEETYVLPLARVVGDEAAALLATAPVALLARWSGAPSGDPDGVIADGAFSSETRLALLGVIRDAKTLEGRRGRLVGTRGKRLDALLGSPAGDLADRLPGAEQSNTSIRYGDRVMLKLFRRPSEGENPEREITELLTDRAGFSAIAPFGGALDYVCPGRPDTTLAILQAFVANQGDAWTWALRSLGRHLDEAASAGAVAPPPASVLTFWLDRRRPAAGAAPSPFIQELARLGERTAELHAALNVHRGLPEVDPDIAGPADLAGLADGMRGGAATALAALAAHRHRVPPDGLPLADRVLASRARIDAVLEAVRGIDEPVVRTRIHGDYHLGQVLRTSDDFVIVDFEGEPTRTLAERRARHSPVKDVAGMLRSFAYAAASACEAAGAGAADPRRTAADVWLAEAGAAFLDAYRRTVASRGDWPDDDIAFGTLLRAYWLDKALYELQYELDNRPSWVGIPLSGVLAGATES